MKTTTSTLFFTAFMAITFPVKASTIMFAFSAPNGALGSSYTYVNNGIGITARGYTGVNSPNIAGAPVSLYGKNGGGDETGLGLVGTGDFEIVGNDFIQLDFSDVKNKMLDPTAQLMIGSVQTDEYYRIYGSNTVGVAGAMLVANGSLDGKFFDIPKFNQYTYFSISAPKGESLPQIAVDFH